MTREEGMTREAEKTREAEMTREEGMTREEDMAKEMMEEGYNPHCKQDVLEYFKEIQDKYGKISEMITLFNLPVEVTWDFFPKKIKE